MARSAFFRSCNSDSSASSTSSNEESLDQSGDDTHGVNISPNDASPMPNDRNLLEPSTARSIPAPSADNRKDLLVHALLEERCMRQVLEEHASEERLGRARPDADLEGEVKAKYRQLCQQLAPFDLNHSGLDSDRYAPTRQKYREGLDMLMRGGIASAPSHVHPYNIRAPLDRRMLTDGNIHQLSNHDLEIAQPRNTLLTNFPYSISLPPPFGPPHPYFQEIKLLGKGGYGAVYQVSHTVDKQEYAIKKVPLSPSRMGEAECRRIANEVETLAKLEHPNIVRYFGSWFDWADFSTMRRSSISSISGFGEIEEYPSDTEVDAIDNRSISLRRVYTQSDSHHRELDVVFEASASISQRLTSHNSIMFQGSSSQVSEGVSRSVAGLMDSTALLKTSQRIYALHVQMSYHPFTLAEYIAPKSDTPLSHCFHLRPSLDIILAILSGVKYLHAMGTVHRDLKPANILMGESKNPRGSVGLQTCAACHEQGKFTNCSLDIRIGDFGLVTTLAQPKAEEGKQCSSVVGTEVYRPTQSTPSASATLDIFALGIITFELLWGFSTGSERLETIKALKQGEFPEDFSEKIGDGTGRVQACIAYMLLQEGGGEVTIKSLRQRLRAIASDLGQKS